MSYVEKILRFTLPLVIVLCVIQFGVLALLKDDTPILEIPVPDIPVPMIPVLEIPVHEIPVISTVNELRAKVFGWITAPFREDDRTKTAKYLSGLSLETRQQFLMDYMTRLTKELDRVDYTDLAAPIIDDFIEDMNGRGIYFE
ncbi:MAG: hypothetical protein OXN17_07915 [Candidatus Poribacteria bacterium]|nr:hypothetical protein [Candidatus Poribacteria bacterium]MDE0503562.1 hypothetical protein [Candidatus Poribacteria bacterium]